VAEDFDDGILSHIKDDILSHLQNIDVPGSSQKKEVNINRFVCSIGKPIISSCWKERRG
jgi:hypothetical protein